MDIECQEGQKEKSFSNRKTTLIIQLGGGKRRKRDWKGGRREGRDKGMKKKEERKEEREVGREDSTTNRAGSHLEGNLP